jgi:hypothetical protein
MGQEREQNAQRETRRYVIVEVRGTLENALDVAQDIEDCGRLALEKFKVEVHVFGCGECGCQHYFPEVESCEDELCGHNCDVCGCFE